MTESSAEHSPSPVDLLVTGGDVVTMNARREVLSGGTVAIGGDRIVAVGSTTELTAAYPDASVLDARDCIVTPGLVNAHEHLTGDPLARSCIPDLLPPGASIFEWSVPLHGAHTGDDDELSALLASAEALHYGVTTLVEAGTRAPPQPGGGGLMRAGVGRGARAPRGWGARRTRAR